jgi:hypothetical protein
VPAGSSGGPSSSGISSLAWVMPGSNVLAVVVAPALLLLWDVSGEHQQVARASGVQALPANACLLWEARDQQVTRSTDHQPEQCLACILVCPPSPTY